MFSKYYNVITRSYIVLAVIASALAIAGCDQNRRGKAGSLALKGALDVHTGTPKAAYVLTSVKDPVLINRFTSAVRNKGSYGMVSVISINDSSDITTDTLSPGAIINYNYTLPDYNTGILGIPTSNFAIVDSVNLTDSFIDVLPDGSSILVSSPDEGLVTQYFLTPDNGSIVIDYVNKIHFDGNVRPGRFVAANNFKENPYVFVATNKGIATLKFTTPTQYGAAGRKYGSVEALKFPPSSSPDAPGPRVLDIAVSGDDQLVIASNERKQVFYKTMDDVKQMLPFGLMDQKGYASLKLKSAPPNIIEPIPQDSVAALTPKGLAFVNSNDPPMMFEWNKLARFNPVDIAFHPSGESVLILTDNYLFFGQLQFPITGLYLNHVNVPGGGAKAMDIDPRGKFAAVVASGSLSFFPMEEGGVVSPPDRPISGLPGDAIGVALR